MPKNIKSENEKPNEYSLTIKGFKTAAQAKAFIEWYEGQGEQNASVWFECRQSEGQLDVDFMPVDCSKKYEWDDSGKNLTAWLKI